ncbi:MAG: acyl transferase [Bacteroidota bacterium]
MGDRNQLKNAILRVDAASFEATALAVFRYQARYNPLYARYLSLLGRKVAEVERLAQIPHLPIGLFKNRAIQTGDWTAEVVFTSSGTTGAQTSRHFIRDLAFYEAICERGFRQFYPPLDDYCLLALLPSYLERSGSSLVYMVQHFMRFSRPESGFFLHDTEALVQRLAACRRRGIPVLLMGVSFALLDLAERFALDLEGVRVVETGGMKGRRRELTRAELHATLRRGLGIPEVHSEYGMTELLSQAWSRGKGIFEAAPTMRVSLREVTDPFAQPGWGRVGAINICDLGNLDSISFIATDDLGRQWEDGRFEVLGRLDGSDVRGCNLLLGEE